MQDSAEIVIIGGGAIGCSIAYHLAQLGKRDVLLLEKAGLTQGATWHAAGLVGQLRGKRNLTRMLRYSVELYGRLEKWAADELRSVNAQIEYLLRDSLLRAGRLGGGKNDRRL